MQSDDQFTADAHAALRKRCAELQSKLDEAQKASIERGDKLVRAVSKIVDLQSRLDSLERAARDLINLLEVVGMDSDWRDGQQTDRVVAWYELDELRRALGDLEPRYDGDTPDEPELCGKELHHGYHCAMPPGHAEPCGAIQECDVEKREPKPNAEPTDANIRELYYDLLFTVGTKHPGESRHETAKRYIDERENAPLRSAASDRRDVNCGLCGGNPCECPSDRP